MEHNIHQLFELKGKTAVVTGGAGLLGFKHAQALMEFGANCILVDIFEEKAIELAEQLASTYSGTAVGMGNSITEKKSVEAILDRALNEFSTVDILINNAANNPKFDDISQKKDMSKRFETFPEENWQADIDVGLKGAFLCSQIFGTYFSKNSGGVILNIASDLGVIAPDQRLYRKDGLPEEDQPTKPVTYSIVKTGLIGLTRYLATYWADKGVRCNALVPGGVYTGQEEVFLNRLTNLIPMQRMASVSEYQAAIVFLCSEASSYMTGTTLTMDGGRTCW